MSKQLRLINPPTTPTTPPPRPPFKKPPAPCALTTRDTDEVLSSMRKTASLHHKMADEAKRKHQLERAWMHYGHRDGVRAAITDVTEAIRRAQGRSMTPKERHDQWGDVPPDLHAVAESINTFLRDRFDDAPTEFWEGVTAVLKVVRMSPDLRTAYTTMQHIADQYILAGHIDQRRRWIIKGMAAGLQIIGRQFPTGHVPY